MCQIVPLLCFRHTRTTIWLPPRAEPCTSLQPPSSCTGSGHSQLLAVRRHTSFHPPQGLCTDSPAWNLTCLGCCLDVATMFYLNPSPFSCPLPSLSLCDALFFHSTYPYVKWQAYCWQTCALPSPQVVLPTLSYHPRACVMPGRYYCSKPSFWKCFFLTFGLSVSQVSSFITSNWVDSGSFGKHDTTCRHF